MISRSKCFNLDVSLSMKYVILLFSSLRLSWQLSIEVGVAGWGDLTGVTDDVLKPNDRESTSGVNSLSSLRSGQCSDSELSESEDELLISAPVLFKS